MFCRICQMTDNEHYVVPQHLLCFFSLVYALLIKLESSGSFPNTKRKKYKQTNELTMISKEYFGRYIGFKENPDNLKISRYF